MALIDGNPRTLRPDVARPPMPFVDENLLRYVVRLKLATGKKGDAYTFNRADGSGFKIILAADMPGTDNDVIFSFLNQDGQETRRLREEGSRVYEINGETQTRITGEDLDPVARLIRSALKEVQTQKTRE